MTPPDNALAVSPPPPPVTFIRPSRGWAAVDFAEIWRCRELFGFLVWRDVKARYKQSLLGFAWAIVGPLATALVFTILFSRLGKFPTGGLPDAFFYMANMVLWRYFATAVAQSSESLVGNQALLTKVYLPRLIIPGATIFTGLVDFAVAFVVLVGIMLYYGIWPSAALLLLPLPVAMAMAAALGIGLVFSALNVKYRDVKHLVPFLTQLLMYVTVIPAFDNVPASVTLFGVRFPWVRHLYALNPMAGAVEAFRWLLARGHLPEGSGPPLFLLSYGLPVTIALLVFGLYYFKRVERQFADIV